MFKRFSIILAIVLIATLSISATALAKGNPSSGSVVTFDSDISPAPSVYIEGGITVSTIGKLRRLDIRDTDRDEDLEIRLQSRSLGTATYFDVDLSGTVFDLTSLDLEIKEGPNT